MMDWSTGLSVESHDGWGWSRAVLNFVGAVQVTDQAVVFDEATAAPQSAEPDGEADAVGRAAQGVFL